VSRKIGLSVDACSRCCASVHPSCSSPKKYHTFCCKRLCIIGVSVVQILLRAFRVCRVCTQTVRPSASVKVAQNITSQPWARSQPRLVGRKSAGRDRRKVTNMNIAFTTPPEELLVFWVLRLCPTPRGTIAATVAPILASSFDEQPSG
jgi:hypothetical protein